MKDIYVVFKKFGGARIEKDKLLAEALSKDHIVVKNPDLSKVQKVSPSYWKWDGSSVVEMNDEEKALARGARTISPVETLFKRTAHIEKLAKYSLVVSVVLAALVIYILIKVGI